MTMFNKDLILQLLENRDGRALLTFWRGRNAVDIAALLESVEDGARQAAVFRTLPKDLAADVFSYLSGPTQARLARSFADGELQQLFDALHLDDAADFLEELPEPAAEQVMRSVIWVMILPLRAAPAPENTMTPTRERLADVP